MDKLRQKHCGIIDNMYWMCVWVHCNTIKNSYEIKFKQYLHTSLNIWRFVCLFPESKHRIIRYWTHLVTGRDFYWLCAPTQRSTFRTSVGGVIGPVLDLLRSIYCVHRNTGFWGLIFFTCLSSFLRQWFSTGKFWSWTLCHGEMH